MLNFFLDHIILNWFIEFILRLIYFNLQIKIDIFEDSLAGIASGTKSEYPFDSHQSQISCKNHREVEKENTILVIATPF